MIQVERYARVGVTSAVDRPYLGAGPVQAGIIITLDCISVSWSEGIYAPWQAINLKMRGPVIRPPLGIGDHIVIRRSPSIPACMWAIVTDLSSDRVQAENGRKDQGIWNVKAVGWFDYLGNVDIVSALELLDSEAVGTVFGSLNREGPPTEQEQEPHPLVALIRSVNVPSPHDFTPRPIPAPVEPPLGGLVGIFEAQLGLVFGAGLSLAKFLSLALRIALPPGMLGTTDQMLRDAIRVVHNGDTAAQFCGPGLADREGAPARACEPIVGQNPNVQPLHNGSSKLLGLIQGTWGADSGLIEMFPSLEDPGGGAASPTDSKPPVNQPVGSTPDTLLPGPGQTLGRNPVLVYRMRPWRTEPLAAWIDRQGRGSGSQQFGAELPSLTIGPLASVALSALQEYPTFGVITWDLSRAAYVTLDDLISISYGQTDSDTVTVVTSQWAGSLTPDAFNGQAGLPIFSQLAAVYGARLYTVAWPFIRGTDAAGDEYKASATQQVAIVAAQAYQWHALGERFISGTVNVRPRADIRIGEPMVIQFPEPMARFVCYVERVTETVEITEDKARHTMSVQFSRGLWNENERTLPPVQRTQPIGDFNERGIA